MALGRRKRETGSLFIPTSELPRSAGHPFYRALNRLPSAQERSILRGLYDRNLKRFAAQPDSAREFLTTGEAPLEHAQNPEKLAALATVIRAVLNLHEIITRN